jgi:hypothetical protein
MGKETKEKKRCNTFLSLNQRISMLKAVLNAAGLFKTDVRLKAAVGFIFMALKSTPKRAEVLARLHSQL